MSRSEEQLTRIFLTGFMGAGKTAVGELLAERLGRTFVDLDTLIEESVGMTVREIFELRGEQEFRRLERHALELALAGEDAVIATGGGTVVLPANLERVRSAGVLVWLNPSFDVILARVGGEEKSNRPLFQDPEQALELYRQRLGAYGQAHVRVDISADESVEQVTGRILLLLREAACAI
jgi:shikimate kinase